MKALTTDQVLNAPTINEGDVKQAHMQAAKQINGTNPAQGLQQYLNLVSEAYGDANYVDAMATSWVLYNEAKGSQSASRYSLSLHINTVLFNGQA